MAPTIGRVALDNGFHGSIPGDWVAPPPQNIHSGHLIKIGSKLSAQRKMKYNASRMAIQVKN